MDFVKQNAMTYTNNDAGLTGIEREVTRGRLEAGKAVTLLAKAISDAYPKQDDLMVAIEKHLRLQVGAARTYHTVDALYVRPSDIRFVSFKFKFLCGAGYKRLMAFAPLLTKLYADPQCALASKVCLTVWSIEVAFPKPDGTVEWWDLRELTDDQVNNLEQLMVNGSNGASSSPVGAIGPTVLTPLVSNFIAPPPLAMPTIYAHENVTSAPTDQVHDGTGIAYGGYQDFEGMDMMHGEYHEFEVADMLHGEYQEFEMEAMEGEPEEFEILV